MKTRAAIEGILKKNTRGRAYLVYYDANDRRNILKLLGPIQAANGAKVRAVGFVENSNLRVIRLRPLCIPRRTRKSRQIEI